MIERDPAPRTPLAAGQRAKSRIIRSSILAYWGLECQH